ncbi:hypothetical protein EV130_104358 [Rhizobium azibense]|uniref:Uncharacterized protein n=1 Tax=Rhizobium azibense TaxID=1136135 RepID=A0A4R3R6K6_9HYPH|nr:hypothetical protein EV130_104358 [Rhizobium azibense]
MYDDIMIAEWIEAAFTPWGSRTDGNELADTAKDPTGLPGSVFCRKMIALTAYEAPMSNCSRTSGRRKLTAGTR